MSKEILIVISGVCVALVPYIGVPSSWKAVLLGLIGAFLVVLGLLLRGETLSQRLSNVESKPPTGIL